MKGLLLYRPGLLLLATALSATQLCADPVHVRHPEGSFHAFLVVKNEDGRRIATGDLTQSAQGARISSRLTFRFLDGSLDDETTVFTQHGTFRLISDHHIQRGPSFPDPLDVLIDATTGQITTRSEKGEVRQDHLKLPLDVSNGLPQTLIMNLPPSSEAKFAYVAPTKKPRLIQISIKPGGTFPFEIGDTKRQAIDYVIHAELGGMAGVFAPMVGKQPADFHVWILPGASPAFIREEGQLYDGGPIWRIEQISPKFGN